MKLILVACNAATSAALPELQERLDVPVVGVITPEAHAAVQATRNRRVGLMATQATVDAGRYAELVRTLDAGVRFFPVACPQLVPLIESDQPFGAATTEAVREYAAPLKEAGLRHGHPRLHPLSADPADLPARLRPRRDARLLGGGDRPRGRRDAGAQGDRERRRPRGRLPLPDDRRSRRLPATWASGSSSCRSTRSSTWTLAELEARRRVTRDGRAPNGRAAAARRSRSDYLEQPHGSASDLAGADAGALHGDDRGGRAALADAAAARAG